MNIEQIDTSKILISLCDRDMENYNVTYESLGMRDIRSRGFIKELLHFAEDKTGVPLSGKRLLIEAMKYEHGCLLLVTVGRPSYGRRYRIKCRSGTYTFRFDSAEDLLSCIEQLCLSCSRLPPSSVTTDSEHYWLILHSAMPDKIYMNIIREFSSFFIRSNVYAVSLLEHTRLISDGNAIHQIGMSLIKR